MPYIVEKYCCEECHKIFNDYVSALEHELECNKCLSCANGYYVYGCEFDCTHRLTNDCGRKHDYKFYKKKEKVSNNEK